MVDLLRVAGFFFVLLQLPACQSFNMLSSNAIFALAFQRPGILDLCTKFERKSTKVSVHRNA